MGELEKYIDNLIRQVKDPKKKKDLISRLKASQSKEQPLEQLTDGKLEEIEKLKKKLKTVSKLNKSLVKVTKAKYQRSTGVGGPFSGRKQEDSRLRTTGAGTGWRGFTEKPEVKQTLPIGYEKKPATTFAVHRRQEHGGKAPLSKLVPTNVKTDDPTPLGQGTKHRDNSKSPVNLPGGDDTRGKDSASSVRNNASNQNRITTAKPDKKSKRQRAKDFLKRLVGRGKKKEKPQAKGVAPTPTSSTATNQSAQQASQLNYQRNTGGDETSQTATAEAGVPVNPPKKDKKETQQESDKETLDRLTTEHNEAKKKRENIFEGKKETKKEPKKEPKKEKKGKGKGKKGKGKKSQKKPITETLDSMSKKESKKKVSQKKEINSMLSQMMNKPTQASKWRKRGNKNAAIIKAMADFLEKDASGYGDLGVANVYPMDSYNEPSLIGKPVGKIETPINDSETYILNGQNKGKKNEQNN
jgi:hypothetical protein